jgi:tetratricopeptide (TPR) repeat protein
MRLPIAGILLAFSGFLVQAQEADVSNTRVFEVPTTRADLSPWDPQPAGLEGSGATTPGGSSAISRARLTHKVPREARQAYERGLRAKRENKLREALEDFRRALQLDPDYWESRAGLADVYYLEGDPGSALEHLDLALAIDPNVESLQVNKTVALLDLGRPAEAEQAARRALRLSPSSAVDHYLIALCQVRQDRVTAETAGHLAAAVGRVSQAKGMFERVQQYISETPAPH